MTVILHGSVAAGRVALVDDEDYELVSRHRWHAAERHRPSGRTEGPYASTGVQTQGRQTKIFMHKMITGYALTDHIDHNGLNNQRSNLRPATVAQNVHHNSPHSGSSSRYKGVCWHRQISRWQAAIRIDGRNVHLGVFDSEVAAARVYDAAAQDVFGEYAYLNFPVPAEATS